MRELLKVTKDHVIITMTVLTIIYISVIKSSISFYSYYANLYAEDAKVVQGTVTAVSEHYDDDNEVDYYTLYIFVNGKTIVKTSHSKVSRNDIIDLYTDDNREIFELSASDYSLQRSGMGGIASLAIIVPILAYLILSIICCKPYGVVISFFVICGTVVVMIFI